MHLISNVITAIPILPSRFISQEYDKFLFFDIDLRTNSQFLDELQNLAGKGTEISIFYSQTLLFLGDARINERWSEKIESVVKELDTQGEYFSLIIAERKGSWVLVQDVPLNLGVWGLKSSNENALKLFHANATNRDWFLSIEHFKEAIADTSSPMRESIDVEFMNTLVANYG